MQEWDAEGYARHARFVSDLGRQLLDLLEPGPGETILDLGCGDGVLTSRIAERGASVQGVDTSPELLLEAAKRGLEVHLVDGQKMNFESSFDAVFSNAALHWMPDADGVLHGVARSLKPGGRFIGELGGHGNVAAIVSTLIATIESEDPCSSPSNPWFFPTAGEYQGMLETHGFRVDQIRLFPRPTILPTNMAGWLETFALPFLQQYPKAVQNRITRRATQILSNSLKDSMGQWTADYVRLRFKATID